jgi:hypothetical protein
MRPAVSRPSLRVEPRGVTATARHYIRDLVYGANDGIITTFAVVCGAGGGALSGIKWNWQSLDSISVKSPLGGR